MTKIKFGTDGWRAIIAKEYTVANVARVAEATAQWLKQNNNTGAVVVGHDCRFAGELFAQTVAKVLCKHGVTVHLAKDFVSTPMVSLGTVNTKSALGVIITASHNPADYNGFKLKGSYGGPLLPKNIEEIESLIPDAVSYNIDELSLESFEKQGLLKYIDLETMYCDHVEANFDLDLIRNSGLSLAYDAMYGAGQNVIRRLLPETTMLHCEHNPSFDGQAPEPIHKNLTEFSEMIKLSGDIDCGLATDGDADRIGLYDEDGEFVDSHHLILLLIHYLTTQKKLTGKVCVAFSVSPKIEKICKHFNIPYQVVKIGFKYVCEVMLNEDVLLGGEESGGIAIKGHIPERDGIWMGLVIWEYMAKTGKTLKQLIAEVYKIVGSFAFDRMDLHLDEALKQRIVETCNRNGYESFGNNKIVRNETIDGIKYFFENGDWLMIRASGTEPVLRVYAESSDLKSAKAILEACKATLLA